MESEKIIMGIIAYVTEYVDEGDYRDKYLEAITGLGSFSYFPEELIEEKTSYWNEVLDYTQDNFPDILDKANEILSIEEKNTLFNVCFELIENDKSKNSLDDDLLKNIEQTLGIDEKYLNELCSDFKSVIQISLKRYFSAKHGLSVEIPNNWEINENPTLKDSKFCAISIKAGLTDVFRENLNIGYSQANNNLNIEEFFEQFIYALKKAMDTFEIISNGKIIIDNKYGKYLIAEIKERDTKYVTFSAFVMKNNLTYTFSCTTNPMYINQFKFLFEHIIRSIKIYTI